jgi:hypothetical protein
VFLQWTIEDPSESGDYQYFVERCESPSGPFAHINQHALDGAFHYIDRDVEIYRKRFQYYYRIHAISPSGESLWSDEKPIEITQKHRNRGTINFGVRRVIQREFDLVLRHLSGTECAILKKKHVGTRCPDCFDPVTKLSLDSHCETCKGTGWSGGYHAPFYTWVRIGADHITTAVATDGRTEGNQVPFKMLDYPILDEDDVIVQLNLNRFFRVDNITSPTLLTQKLFQSGILMELAKGDIEYKIRDMLGGNEETVTK